jgi:hypothetical protein
MEEKRKRILVQVAAQLHTLILLEENEFDDEEDGGDAGHSPMLCPSCTTYLDHESFWRFLEDDTVVHQMKCAQCKATISMLIHLEPMMKKTDIGSPHRDNPTEEAS